MAALQRFRSTFGLQILSWCVLASGVAPAACGDEEDPPPADPGPAPDVTITHHSAGDPATPSLKIAGAAGQTQKFWVENGLPKQALYTDERRNINVRMFFDAAGDLIRAQDERSGAFLQFEYPTARSIAMLVHDGTGRFLGGHVVMRTGDAATYGSAPILGIPPFRPQLRATLSGATRPAEIVAWPDHPHVRGETRQVPQPVMHYLLLGPRPSAPASAASSAAGGALLALAHQSPGGIQATRGLIRGLQGAILVYAGTQIGAITAGTAAAVAAPLLAVVAVAAGSYYIGQGLEGISVGVLSMFEEAHSGFARDRDPVELVREMEQRMVMNLPAAITRPITRVLENVTREGTTLLQDIQALVKPAPPPTHASPLTGTVYEPDGSTELSGEVTAAGKVTLSNGDMTSPVNIEAEVSDAGKVSGTFTGELGIGTVDGGIEDVPTSCAAPQVLMDERRCGTPPVSCDPPATIQNGVCVAPPVIQCAPPFVMMNGRCVEAPKTCTPPQVLENGMCVTPTVAVPTTYVLSRQDLSGFKIYSTRNDTTLTADSALAKAQASTPGSWKVQLVSKLPGWGSMFCVAPTGGANPAYFTAEGKPTESEAITDAKNQAIASTTPQTNPIRYTFICGTWQNR